MAKKPWENFQPQTAPVSEPEPVKKPWEQFATDSKKKSGSQAPVEPGPQPSTTPSGIGSNPLSPNDPFGIGETVVKQIYQGFGDQIPKAFAQAVEVGVSAMQPANTDEYIKRQAHVDFQKYVRERDPEFVGDGGFIDKAKGLITPFDIDKYLPKYKEQFIKDKGLGDVQKAIEEKSPDIIKRRLAVEQYVKKQNKESEGTLRGIAQSYKEIKTPGDAVRYATNMAAQGLWQIPLTIATRGLSGVAMESSTVYDTQLDQIVENHNAQHPKDQIDRDEAIKRNLDKPAEGQFYAIAAAGLDYVSAEGLLSIVKGGGSNFVKNALAVTTETLTEPTQGMLEEMGGAAGAGGDVGKAFKDAWTKNLSRRIDEAAGGFFGSGATTFVGSAIKSKEEQPTEPTPPPVEPTPTEQPAAEAQPTTPITEQVEKVEETSLTSPEVKAQRNNIKETIHSVAEEAGIDVDTQEFKDLSKQITGLSHLDKMNTKNLTKVLDYVQLLKEANDELNQINEKPQEPTGEIGGQGEIQQNAPQENIQAQETEKVEPEAVAGEPIAIPETPKQQTYGKEENVPGPGEKTQKVKYTKTGEQKQGSPVKKRTNRPEPLSTDVKNVVLEYDEEARNPSISEVDRQIAGALTGVKMDRDSIVNTVGDKNAFTPAIAKSYTKKGGANIDQIAAQVSETLGQEVTPEQVWEFMKNYPQGPKTISTPSGNPKLQEIVNRYVDLTGKGLNQKTARDIINRPDFYDGLSNDLDKSGLSDNQIDTVEKEIYQAGVEVAPGEEDILDSIINQYKTDGVIDWKAIQKALDDPFENESISQLTEELYGKLEERTKQGIRQADTEGDVAGQGEEVQQRGLAERISSQIRSLRSAKTAEERVRIAAQIVQDTGKYLLNRQGVITGTDASFADKGSPTFFDLIDAGKSVYLMDENSKIAETPEDYARINAALKDKVELVNGSMMFDDAFKKGAVQAAKDLGYDALRLTEIDGTNSTLQVFNFDTLTHIAGKDFVAERAKPKGPHQIEAEARIKKAEQAVKGATEAIGKKKAQLAKSLAQDQLDLMGNRIGDEGKLFQEGAGDRNAAKKQLDELNKDLEKAKDELAKANKILTDATEADKTTLFSQSKKDTTAAEKELDALTKPDVKLEFAPAAELAKHPVATKHQQDAIKDDFKKLKQIIDCLW
jgi:hypothetical protein